MRYNALTLAVVALIAIGASGVVAAGMDAPAADSESAEVLPANHTVDVVNPDEVSDGEVDQALETAWANDDVQSYFADRTAIHFDVWASELDDGIVHVKIAPADTPDETRAIADVDLDQETVTSIDEPVTLNASNSMSIDTSDNNTVSIDDTEYELNGTDANSDENATRYTADQATQFQFNESSIERGGDGTFSIELEDDDGTNTDVSIEEIFRIDLSRAT